LNLTGLTSQVTTASVLTFETNANPEKTAPAQSQRDKRWKEDVPIASPSACGSPKHIQSLGASRPP